MGWPRPVSLLGFAAITAIGVRDDLLG